MGKFEITPDKAGQFVDGEGNVVSNPDPSQPLVIVAGLWGHAPRGAMQGKCSICAALVALDQRSQAMSDEPGRVVQILCTRCWGVLEDIRAGNMEAVVEAIDRMVEEDL
jgi:hypothetical protein